MYKNTDHRLADIIAGRWSLFMFSRHLAFDLKVIIFLKKRLTIELVSANLIFS